MLFAIVPGFGQTESAWFKNGNELHQLCRTAKDTSTAYVMGVLDQESFMSALQGAKSNFCIRQGVQAEQARDVVCRYLDKHPEHRDMRAGWLATTALADAFPCR